MLLSLAIKREHEEIQELKWEFPAMGSPWPIHPEKTLQNRFYCILSGIGAEQIVDLLNSLSYTRALVEEKSRWSLNKQSPHVEWAFSAGSSRSHQINSGRNSWELLGRNMFDKVFLPHRYWSKFTITISYLFSRPAVFILEYIIHVWLSGHSRNQREYYLFHLF